MEFGRVLRNIRNLSNEERECEEHFLQNTARDIEAGRFIIKLSLCDDHLEVGAFEENVIQRFHAIERTLIENY